jgi:hypothetical protein
MRAKGGGDAEESLSDTEAPEMTSRGAQNTFQPNSRALSPRNTSPGSPIKIMQGNSSTVHNSPTAMLDHYAQKQIKKGRDIQLAERTLYLNY